MYSLKDNEGTIINNVRADFFNEYDCRKLIGNIDFSVAIPHDGKELFPDMEYVLWAEAKQGNKHKLYESFIQLILTIGKERTIDKYIPPKFLGAFDAEKIAFIPYSALMAVFAIHDFNWNVTPSDHESKEFKLLKELVREELNKTGKEAENVFVFDFFNDKKELQRFIKRNFVSGRDDVRRIRVNQNNFTHICDKWRDEVKNSIRIDWKEAAKYHIYDYHFFLADLMSEDGTTLLKNLKVLLQKDHYDMKERLGKANELFDNSAAPVGFKDNMVAHKKFWSKYARPPKEEYRKKIVDRQDLLVPQNIREEKGSYYTPRVWVEKSQEYLEEVLTDNWQEDYYIWDCCAGTGNLLRGLSNKNKIWASELFESNVRIMHQQIDSDGDGAKLWKSHVFQFDFLNDPFSKLPEDLQDIINDSEKRKRLIIYINPPYKEATNAKTVTGSGRNQSGAATENKIYKDYKDLIGKSIVELFAQFFMRIYKEIPGATLAEFSTLKILQASNFADFRRVFKAKLEKAFVVPANTFDNVTGQFPIGFFIWNTSIQEDIPESVVVDIYNPKGEFEGTKTIITANANYPLITKWISSYKPTDKTAKVIGYERIQGSDFQNNKFTCLVNKTSDSHATFLPIIERNLIPACVNLAVRISSEANWLNDRDQFFSPNENWKYDRDFQADCLAYTLFHGQNRITSTLGGNHWIPFTEQQVKSPDCFKSHFMSDFIAGKIKITTGNSLFEEESYIPTEPIHFTPAAQAVMEAGRKIWEYYFHHKDGVAFAAPVNVDASFYDIRAYFQDFKDGKMKADSDDKGYMSLLKELRHYQKVLAKQIEKKVYLYGFLKGEVEVNKDELLAEYQERVKKLEHQLHAQQSGSIINYGTININDNSTTLK